MRSYTELTKGNQVHKNIEAKSPTSIHQFHQTVHLCPAKPSAHQFAGWKQEAFCWAQANIVLAYLSKKPKIN